ncbi:MAG: bifunctional 2-methylcitrate dehydratase/aconitate hydratase [Firmicutes bacterium]|nr:bifunctional 2-methylcitrate dehydratase/aconitate hydratase [Bacillota bacterium]
MDLEYDQVIQDIADYTLSEGTFSELAMQTAGWVLMDALGCAVLALNHPQCVNLLGGLAPGVEVVNGARVPGTRFVLDPVEAAFNLGTMIRWLDYNDTWLALEWGHPSDNIGAILTVADWVSRTQREAPVRIEEVLRAMVKAHEIQGVLSLSVGLNRVGFDHVWWTKVASTAVVAMILGADRTQVVQALSQAFIDGGSLRTYRHAPNTGSRKSWAAGDAVARAVRLALISMRGEMGYPTALSAPTWGFEDVVLHGETLRLDRPLSDYVMENVLFKVAYPAEFHGQTAVECAIALYPEVAPRLDQVERIDIETQESAMRIINKTGVLKNPADRDHSLQYMVAVGLVYGEVTDRSYGQEVAADPRLDRLRAKMVVVERPEYSREYLEPQHRSIANAVQVHFSDGTSSDRIEIRYPLGHRQRRQEAWPRLFEKLGKSVGHLPTDQQQKILALAEDPKRLAEMSVEAFVDTWIPANTVWGQST